MARGPTCWSTSNTGLRQADSKRISTGRRIGEGKLVPSRDKRLRREYEGRDKLGGGPNNPRDKDPMEVQNLLAEKRKELSDLCKVGEGLDRIADAQKRAEAAQNALSPEVAERLARMKDH